MGLTLTITTDKPVYIDHAGEQVEIHLEKIISASRGKLRITAPDSFHIHRNQHQPCNKTTGYRGKGGEV